tara:strand:+ start:200 stop:943 length:744 start_codon:yes stop_codon:yes gene_type:complete
MAKDDVDMAKMREEIDSGEYFTESREWYSRIYVAPISQRVFFLIITAICSFIFVFAFMGIVNLLPIVDIRPFFYPTTTDDMMNRRLRLEPLRQAREPINAAMQRFYLTQFVKNYEAYNESEYNTRRNFIYQYAVPEVFSTYDQQISPSNRNSPIRRYGKYAVLNITVQSVQYIEDSQPLTARVQFEQERVERNERERTNWMATISYEWSDLREENRYDDDKDNYVLDLVEPEFKVLSYQIQPQVMQP